MGAVLTCFSVDKKSQSFSAPVGCGKIPPGFYEESQSRPVKGWIDDLTTFDFLTNLGEYDGVHHRQRP